MVSIFHFVPSLALNYVPANVNSFAQKQSPKALVQKGSSNNLSTEPTYRGEQTKPTEAYMPPQTLIGWWGGNPSCNLRLGVKDRCHATMNNGSNATVWLDSPTNDCPGGSISGNFESSPSYNATFTGLSGGKRVFEFTIPAGKSEYRRYCLRRQGEEQTVQIR